MRRAIDRGCYLPTVSRSLGNRLREKKSPAVVGRVRVNRWTTVRPINRGPLGSRWRFFHPGTKFCLAPK